MVRSFSNGGFLGPWARRGSAEERLPYIELHLIQGAPREARQRNSCDRVKGFDVRPFYLNSAAKGWRPVQDVRRTERSTKFAIVMCGTRRTEYDGQRCRTRGRGDNIAVVL